MKAGMFYYLLHIFNYCRIERRTIFQKKWFLDQQF